VESAELAEELGPGQIEQALQAILEPGRLHREAVPLHRQKAQLYIRRLQKREADEDAHAEQLGDLGGVLGVGLQGAVVFQLLGPMGVRREHIDHRIAAVGQEPGEGEAMVPGKLKADEHLGWGVGQKQRLEVRIGCLEPGTTHHHGEWLGAVSIGPQRHQHVELLGGIHANVNRKLPRVGGLLVGGHGRLLTGT
jgi:hypothetical protein